MKALAFFAEKPSYDCDKIPAFRLATRYTHLVKYAIIHPK